MTTHDDSRFLTRRRFLARAGGATIAVALTGTSLRALAQDAASPATSETVVAAGMSAWVDLELVASEFGRWRRPYVAVWLEDAEGLPVRTLGLWIGRGKTQWLGELRRWNRADLDRRFLGGDELVWSVSTPTRAPGVYRLHWDGLDDEGEAVPIGDYWFCVETAKQDGPYELLREPVTFGDEPFDAAFEGGRDVGRVTLAYGPDVAR